MVVTQKLKKPFGVSTPFFTFRGTRQRLSGDRDNEKSSFGSFFHGDLA